MNSGTQVLVVSCTGGERGDVQNPGLVDMAMAERDIAGLRRFEMARAREAVGFDHLWLGYEDSGLPDDGEEVPPGCFATIPLEISAEPLVRIIREFRPQVMITYDEAGGYPHPDHIRTHEISIFAMEAAADPDRYPDAGDPWAIQKVYYDRIFNSTRVNSMFEALTAQQPDSPLLEQLDGFRQRFGERPDVSTTHVNVGEFFDVRDAALRAHASQVAPDSGFFFWPNELQRDAWPFEDYQLVTSLVDSELPESDLFSGIESEESST